MPQMGESIAEGTLSKWLKKVGDTVKRDEPIFEISTDKVDAEIPASTAGVLVEIVVKEGETVPVQAVVARLETDVAAAAASVSAPPPAAAAGSQPAAASPAASPQASAVSSASGGRPPAASPVAPAPAGANGGASFE